MPHSPHPALERLCALPGAPSPARAAAVVAALEDAGFTLLGPAPGASPLALRFVGDDGNLELSAHDIHQLADAADRAEPAPWRPFLLQDVRNARPPPSGRPR